MRAGQLKHRLLIQRPGYTQDPVTGEMVPGWTTYAAMWGRVEGVQGREYLAAASEQAETTWRVTARYVKGVKPADRIVNGEQILNIKAILPNNDRTQLVLMCEETT